MKNSGMNRRHFLQSGSTLIMLPLLESLLPATARAAAGAQDPKRFISFYYGSGTYMGANNGAFWQPQAAGRLDPNNLPVVFQPFAANAADFSVIRGVLNWAKGNVKNSKGDITNGHTAGMSTFLTTQAFTNSDATTCSIKGNSFDVELSVRNNWPHYALSAGGNARWLVDETKFPYHLTPSYRNGALADLWLNPYKLFYSQGLFQNATTTTVSPGATAPANSPYPTLARNRSILDGTYQAILSLKNKVSASDKKRIDDYTDSLRAIERSLASQPTPTPSGSTCQVSSAVPTSLNSSDDRSDSAYTNPDFADRIRAFCDVMILALKCDRARLFSMVLEIEGLDRHLFMVPARLNYKNSRLGEFTSHNNVAHWDFAKGQPGLDLEQVQNMVISRDRFYADFVFYMVNALKQATDPSGSPILDNTIIQFGNGLIDGSHTYDSWGYSDLKMAREKNPQGMAMMLAGGRNMINPGNHHVLNADLKDLLFTINKAIGGGMTDWMGSSNLVKI